MVLPPRADRLVTAARASHWYGNQVDGLHGLARLGFVAAEVEIRPGSAADLVALVAALGQRDFFADRLARQHEGRGVLLVAWLAHRPVGDVYLLREPADVPEVRRYLPGVPQLDHLGRGPGDPAFGVADEIPVEDEPGE